MAPKWYEHILQVYQSRYVQCRLITHHGRRMGHNSKINVSFVTVRIYIAQITELDIHKFTL